MNDKTVLISGAGIAGPILAFWLKAAGFEPTLIELAPETDWKSATEDMKDLEIDNYLVEVIVAIAQNLRRLAKLVVRPPPAAALCAA